MFTILTLKNEKTGEYYDILRKSTHLVSRYGFNGDLEISDDSSISRSHAELCLVKKVICGKIRLNLEIKDKQSKYGTFINEGIDQNEQIRSDYTVDLVPGDRIRFGIMNNIWIVVEYPIVVCPSTLKIVHKDILKRCVTKFGGKVTNNWTNQCSHLCMNTVSITEKVLFCLASGKSIVPLKYFIDLSEALTQRSMIQLPSCEDYKPDFSDNLLNPNSISLNVNIKRKTLFSQKTFICSSMNQLIRISNIVQAAGGNIINYDDGVICDDDILNSKEYIVMQQDLCDIRKGDNYQLILEKLKMVNKKPIAENDIGLAIIFSNIEIYCNPEHDVPLVNLQSQPSLIEPMVLAPDTEVLTIESSEIFSINTIPDSVPQTYENIKRPNVIMDSEELVIPKKRASFNNKEKIENCVLTQHISNHTFKSLDLKKKTINNMLTNADSCLTVPSSSDLSNKLDFSTELQPTTVDKNINSINLETRTTNKRKMSDVCSMFNNDDSDPFNYEDIDEIDEPKKKAKKDEDSIFLPILPSNNMNNQSKSTEINAKNVVDPNLVMNLLATAKDDGQFIDASNLSDKSSFNMYKDTENNDLLNSVIVEIVNLVVLKPTQTPNVLQENSQLKNFKKFKRKAPTMGIPNIVPLQLSQID